jgi:hypothetical protein
MDASAGSNMAGSAKKQRTAVAESDSRNAVNCRYLHMN